MQQEEINCKWQIFFPFSVDDIWVCLNLTFLKPWWKQCIFLTEILNFFLSYVSLRLGVGLSQVWYDLVPVCLPPIVLTPDDSIGEGSPLPHQAIAEEVGGEQSLVKTDRSGHRETRPFLLGTSVQEPHPEECSPPSSPHPSLTPTFLLIRNTLCSCVYLGRWGLMCLGISLETVLPCPHPADAWPGLYISGAAYLKHRLLFLENYKCRGLGGEAWGPRTGVKGRNSGVWIWIWWLWNKSEGRREGE